MKVENFSHAATVFPVQDIEKSIEFYRDKLGFDVTFEWGEPVQYAVLKSGDVSVHLVVKDDPKYQPSSVHTALYVFVHDVDEVYEELKANGASITNEIADRDYGMRDFDITDPDGFQLCFAMGISEDEGED